MSGPGLFAAGLGLSAALMAVVFLVALRLRNFSIVDIAWSGVFTPLVLLAAAFAEGYGPRRALIATMVTLWSLRLAVHLYRRIAALHPEEEGRYVRLRQEWAANLHARFFAFFQAQGALAALLSVPFLLASIDRRAPLGPFEIAGAALFVVALAGESIADRQLAAFKAEAAAAAERRAVAVVTRIDSGEQRMISRTGAGNDPLAAVLDEAFRFDQSGVHGDEFVHVYNPPLRLVIIGAVHIAQGVIPMALQAGYDITVIDPRGAFATGARFPDVALHADWPDEILPRLGLDARTAFLALTHDPKIDDPALALALKSEVFYIGALGSKKTQGSRVDRLKALGFDDAELRRIHGPIGLAIGAKGAAEIAISIMAEMTKSLRLGD